MKYILGICLSLIGFMAQAQLYSNTSLWIPDGSLVYIDGEFENDVNSKLTNNGTIVAKGDIVNEEVFTSHYSGLLRLEGVTEQIVRGGQTFYAYNVDVNNSSGVTLNNSIYADGLVQFKDGIVTALDRNFPLIFTVLATSDLERDSSHVNGYVTKEGAVFFSYPVGDGARYQKVDVNATVNDTGLTVRYHPQDAGTSSFTADGTESELLQSYNSREYWDISPNSNSIGEVTIYWDDYHNPTIYNLTTVKVAHLHNSAWLNEGTNGVGSLENGSVTSNAVSQWSPFTLGATNKVLPVELMSFNATSQDLNAQLIWSTATENNNSHFNVQRSLDGVNFKTVGKVQGAGTTNETKGYSYVDANVGTLSNEVYYRLEQVDFDGTTDITDIRLVAFSGVVGQKIFPNPVFIGQNVSIQSKNMNIVELFNASGKLVTTIHLNGQNATSFNTSNLAKGVYVVVINNGESTQKLVIQ